MKKIWLTLLLCLCVGCVCLACDSGRPVTPDYDSAAAYETALENGEDTLGRTVSFTVGEIKPDSLFGYDLWAGEHLNFVSDINPNVHVGDRLTVRITDVRNVLGSWIIRYEMISEN